MLTCKVGENTVNTIDYEDEQIRKWSNKGILKCPVCNSKMIYKHGEIKIAHFAHEKGIDCEDIYLEPETEEHLNGKKIIYKWLKKQEDIHNLQLESWIPETKQRPDLYFEINSNRYVIEFQCTPIATEYLERHRLYELAGITDIWILGMKKYNIEILKNKQAHHLKRLKEIEKHSNFYLNVDKKNIIVNSNIISDYIENKVLKLEDFYVYPISNFRFDIKKSLISPIDDILNKFIEKNHNEYLIIKKERDKIEEEIRERKAKEKEKLIFKQELELNSNKLINELNNQYKIVSKNCNFTYDNGNSVYYLGRVDFSSNCGDFTFFIKYNKTDCCTEYFCTKVDYLGGRGKHGGLRRRYYQSTAYSNKESIEYDNINMQTIKNFICTNVSNLLREKKYGVE